MPSASLIPSVIDQYLIPELERGWVAGPFSLSPVPNLISCSKHHSVWDYPKKIPAWQVAPHLDLPSPTGNSVNDGSLLWAACCLGFFGFLRAGEFTTKGPFDALVHLTPADLQVDSNANLQSLRVFIKCSHTDPFWQGCFIFIGPGSLPLCPVTALSNYLHLLGPGARPLFPFQDGFPLSRFRLSSGKFSGHSFSIGAATTVAQKGLPDHLIKTLGCWSSDAYLLYVRTLMETILLVTAKLS